MTTTPVITNTPAIDSLANELRKVTADLHRFQPESEKGRTFFIGEALIVAIATELLTAFFKQLTATLQDKLKGFAQNAGKQAGDTLSGWLISRSRIIQGLSSAKGSDVILLAS